MMKTPTQRVTLYSRNSAGVIDHAYSPMKVGTAAFIPISQLDTYLARFGRWARLTRSPYHAAALRMRGELRKVYVTEKLHIIRLFEELETLLSDDAKNYSIADDAGQTFALTFTEPESWNGIRLVELYDKFHHTVHVAQCTDSWAYTDEDHARDHEEAPDDASFRDTPYHRNHPYHRAIARRNEASRAMRRYLSITHKTASDAYKAIDKQIKLDRRGKDQESIDTSTLANGDTPPEEIEATPEPIVEPTEQEDVTSELDELQAEPPPARQARQPGRGITDVT